MLFTQSHPKVLPYLFLTEMWERLGFYVVQGLLILYMTQNFGYSDADGYIILGIFSALVYISPFIGGVLADKLLGFKTSVIWGGLFLVVGYALLAIPFPLYEKLLFYPALATIIVGNGLFKPNVSSFLGTQYDHDDPRRDSGFTIFYVGINLGAFLAGISSGYIKDYFGWHVSFSLASVGLIIGLITFGYGLSHVKPHSISEKKINHKTKFQLFLCCVLAIIGLNFLLKMQSLSSILLPIAGILLLFVLIVLTLMQAPIYRKRMFILIMLVLSSIVYWTLFLQMFFSFNLFIDRLVEKNFLGLNLNTTVFYASESIFIILFGPLFAMLWQKLGYLGKNPSSMSKFILGILFAGLGCLVLSLSTSFPNESGLIHPLWVLASYCLITIGELLVSPIGLSAVTQLAPKHLSGMMMGVWFVALGFGGIFAGMLAKSASIPESAVTLSAKLNIYQNAFLDYSYLAFLVVIVLFFLYLGTRKWL